MKGITTNVIRFSENRKYLITFLKKVLEKDTKERIVLAGKLNDLLFALVKKAPADYVPENHTPEPFEIVLTLPDWKDKKTEYNYYISPNSMRIIENFVYNHFWLIFEQHMMEINFIGFKHAVYNFIEQYELEEEKYDMLIRRDRRYRNAMIPENTKKISSAFLV
jgi:hypothetical protein